MLLPFPRCGYSQDLQESTGVHTCGQWHQFGHTGLEMSLPRIGTADVFSLLWLVEGHLRRCPHPRPQGEQGAPLGTVSIISYSSQVHLASFCFQLAPTGSCLPVLSLTLSIPSDLLQATDLQAKSSFPFFTSIPPCPLFWQSSCRTLLVPINSAHLSAGDHFL